MTARFTRSMTSSTGTSPVSFLPHSRGLTHINSATISGVIAFLLSWKLLTNSWRTWMHLAFSSPVVSSPLMYDLRIDSSSSSDSRKKDRYWNATSTFGFPPNFRCSSRVGCPPEKAYLLIFFFLVRILAHISWPESHWILHGWHSIIHEYGTWIDTSTHLAPWPL